MPTHTHVVNATTVTGDALNAPTAIVLARRTGASMYEAPAQSDEP